MEKKKSLAVTALGGLFLGFALLPIFYYIFHAYQMILPIQLFLVIVPNLILYLFFAIMAFTKWSKFLSWQKGALVGIGIQSILLYFWMLIQMALLEKTLYGFMFSLYEWVNFILSPLSEMYGKFVITPRAVFRNGVYVSYTSLWESQFLFLLFRIIYAAVVGAIVAKVIEKRRHCLQSKGVV